MSKPNKPETPATAPTAAPVVAAVDPLALAVPSTPQQVATAAIFRGGHQCVIDQSVPGRLSIHIPTNDAAFGNLWMSDDAQEKAASGKAAPKYLAVTEGRYGSCTVMVGGRKCYVKASVQLAKA